MPPSPARSAATADVLRLESGELVGMVATICHFGSVDSRTKAKHELSKLRQDCMLMVLPCSAIARHAGLLGRRASGGLILELS